MTVEIIIPFFNGSSFILRALAGLACQTLEPARITVVDDGSDLSESSFLRDLCRDFPLTNVVMKANGGQGSARNFGARQSQADYIVFLDQDDVLLPDSLEVLVTAAQSSKSDVCYGDAMQSDLRGDVVRMSSVKSSPHPKTHIIEVFQQDMNILPSATLIRLGAFMDVGGFDENLIGYEDDDLFARMFLAGKKFHFVDAPLVISHQHETNTSMSPKMADSRLLFFRKWASYFSSSETNLKSRFMIDIVGDLLGPRLGSQFVHELHTSKMANTSSQNQLRNLKEFILFADELGLTGRSWCRAFSRRAKMGGLPNSIYQAVFVGFGLLQRLKK